MMKKLDRDFYQRDTLKVSRELLGKYIVHIVNGEELTAKITEVEAYIGPEDKAAHSYKNRKTERNTVMFGEAGFAYVYFIYGMYYCMNVVTRGPDMPEAVLIRKVEPIKELESMALKRFGKGFNELNKTQLRSLTNGPGKLCMALDIDKNCNGKDLCGDELYILEDEKSEKFTIGLGKRINIDYAEEARDYLWRFFIQE